MLGEDALYSSTIKDAKAYQKVWLLREASPADAGRVASSTKYWMHPSKSSKAILPGGGLALLTCRMGRSVLVFLLRCTIRSKSIS